MRSAYIDTVGDPSCIRYGELRDPAPGPGQAVVGVAAVTVNPVDTYLRSGRWRTPLSLPVAVGRDLVGTVTALGSGVSDLSPGEWVWTNSAGYGGRAGATATPSPLTGCALSVRPRCFVTEATDAPAAAAKAATTGVDVFVDTTGHVNTAAVPANLNPRGRILLLAGRGRADLDLWPFEVREIHLLGFVMSAMTVPELAAAADWINTTHPDRPLIVDVGEVLGFHDAAHAHTLLESSQLPRTPDGTVGRLVLHP